LTENVFERGYLSDLGVDERMVLKWILEKSALKMCFVGLFGRYPGWNPGLETDYPDRGVLPDS
jgi:hypothetical protein